jgi:hypothetical protein
LSAASYSITITKDTINPTIDITSHTNNQQVSGASIILSGTASDANGIASILINGSGATGTGSRTKTVDLI